MTPTKYLQQSLDGLIVISDENDLYTISLFHEPRENASTNFTSSATSSSGSALAIPPCLEAYRDAVKALKTKFKSDEVI